MSTAYPKRNYRIIGRRDTYSPITVLYRHVEGDPDALSRCWFTLKEATRHENLAFRAGWRDLEIVKAVKP